MTATAAGLPDLTAAVARADERRLALREQLAERRVDLPLRFWRQQVHFTTPAERDIAIKALTGGTGPMTRILERFADRAPSSWRSGSA